MSAWRSGIVALTAVLWLAGRKSGDQPHASNSARPSFARAKPGCVVAGNILAGLSAAHPVLLWWKLMLLSGDKNAKNISCDWLRNARSLRHAR